MQGNEVNLFQPAIEFLPMIDKVRDSFLFNANFDVLVCFAYSQSIYLCRFIVPLSGLPKILKGQQLRTINSVSLYITVTLIKM